MVRILIETRNRPRFVLLLYRWRWELPQWQRRTSGGGRLLLPFGSVSLFPGAP